VLIQDADLSAHHVHIAIGKTYINSLGYRENYNFILFLRLKKSYFL